MSELTGIETKRVIPSYASFNEATLYVIEAMETEYQNMMMNIGLKELGVLEESGEVIVYEGKSLKDIKDAFIQIIKNAFASVKDLFDTALKWIKEKVDTFKANTKAKNLDLVKKKAENLKDKEYGKTYQYPGFEDLINKSGEIWNAIEGYESKINSITFDKSSYSNMSLQDASKEIKENLEKEKEKLCKALGGDPSAKDIRTKLQEKLRGSEIKIDKQYIVKNVADMFDNATNYGKTVSTTKKLYNGVKKNFDTSIANIKKTTDMGDGMDMRLNLYRPYLLFGKRTVITISGVCLGIVKEKLSTDMKIVAKLYLSLGKGEGKSVKTESTIEPSTYQAELANLFSFN